MDIQFIPNSCFSGGEEVTHFARTLADVGKMWGKKFGHSMDKYYLCIKLFTHYPNNHKKDTKVTFTSKNRQNGMTRNRRPPYICVWGMAGDWIQLPRQNSPSILIFGTRRMSVSSRRLFVIQSFVQRPMKNSGNSKALSRGNTNVTRTIWTKTDLKLSLTDSITPKSTTKQEKKNKT